MTRSIRKINKKRGTRTSGAGNHKKNRGAGNKGGVGMGGGHKGKMTYILKYFGKDYFGRHGFDLPKERKNIYKSINVGFLDEYSSKLVDMGVAEMDGERVIIDLCKMDCEKVLGKGKVRKNLVVKAKNFSAVATKKIEANGGEAITVE